jgi:large subunit ribosomal protein L4
MAKAPILGGTAKDTVTLDDDVFGAPFNGPLVHEVVIAEMAARRQGTQSTKTRGQVSGGNSKPWRQKGTGRARVGSSRNPVWTGGGHAFALQPRHYTVKVNRKARRAALRSALSIHADRGSLAVLDAAGIDAPSTKRGAELLGDRLNGHTLLVVDRTQEVTEKSFRNLERVLVVPADNVNVADIVRASSLVLSREALDHVTALARKPERRAQGVLPAAGETAPDAEEATV